MTSTFGLDENSYFTFFNLFKHKVSCEESQKEIILIVQNNNLSLYFFFMIFYVMFGIYIYFHIKYMIKKIEAMTKLSNDKTFSMLNSLSGDVKKLNEDMLKIKAIIDDDESSSCYEVMPSEDDFSDKDGVSPPENENGTLSGDEENETSTGDEDEFSDKDTGILYYMNSSFRNRYKKNVYCEEICQYKTKHNDPGDHCRKDAIYLFYSDDDDVHFLCSQHYKLPKFDFRETYKKDDSEKIPKYIITEVKKQF